MADCVTNLAEAKAALHKLSIGSQVASATINDVDVTYTQAQIDSLRKYVRELEAECGDTAADGTNPSRRGAYKFFG